MKILAVDDNPLILKIIERALSEAGTEVLKACSVRKAIHQLQREPDIALVILDVVMPEESGFVLLDYLTDNLRFRQIPVIMCTSLEDRKTVIGTLKHGARDYIVKPFTARSLREKVHQTLALARKTVVHLLADPELGNILGRTIERDGFNAMPVATCAEALKAIDENKADLLITDIALPGESGWDLLIGAKEKRECLPVLVVLERGRAGTVDPLGAGADGVILKPFEGPTIGRAIREAFAKSAHSRIEKSG